MKYWLGYILIPLLVGCKATIPSEAITNNAINELNGVTATVEHIQATTPAQCKTEALTANLNAIKTQISSVSGQIKNISLACETEKNVLEEKLTVRNIIIFSLAGALIFLFVLFFKLK